MYTYAYMYRKCNWATVAESEDCLFIYMYIYMYICLYVQKMELGKSCRIRGIPNACFAQAAGVCSSVFCRLRFSSHVAASSPDTCLPLLFARPAMCVAARFESHVTARVTALVAVLVAAHVAARDAARDAARVAVRVAATLLDVRLPQLFARAAVLDPLAPGEGGGVGVYVWMDAVTDCLTLLRPPLWLDQVLQRVSADKVSPPISPQRALDFHQKIHDLGKRALVCWYSVAKGGFTILLQHIVTTHCYNTLLLQHKRALLC